MNILEGNDILKSSEAEIGVEEAVQKVKALHINKDGSAEEEDVSVVVWRVCLSMSSQVFLLWCIRMYVFNYVMWMDCNYQFCKQLWWIDHYNYLQ